MTLTVPRPTGIGLLVFLGAQEGGGFGEHVHTDALPISRGSPCKITGDLLPASPPRSSSGSRLARRPTVKDWGAWKPSAGGMVSLLTDVASHSVVTGGLSPVILEL